MSLLVLSYKGGTGAGCSFEQKLDNTQWNDPSTSVTWNGSYWQTGLLLGNSHFYNFAPVASVAGYRPEEIRMSVYAYDPTLAPVSQPSNVSVDVVINHAGPLSPTTILSANSGNFSPTNTSHQFTLSGFNWGNNLDLISMAVTFVMGSPVASSFNSRILNIEFCV